MFYHAVLLVCVCLVSWPRVSLAQSKPSNDQIVSSVGKAYSKAVESVATAAVGLGQLRIWIDRVEVLRFGAFNSKEKYWPVEVCVVARAQNASLGLISQAPIERISAKVRYRFQIDDFKEWIATELPPPSNVTAALLNCQTKEDREQAFFDQYVRGYLTASGAKSVVEGFFRTQNRMPKAGEVDLLSGQSKREGVDSVTNLGDGSVIVKFQSAAAGGASIRMTPSIKDSEISWRCTLTVAPEYSHVVRENCDARR